MSTSSNAGDRDRGSDLEHAAQPISPPEAASIEEEARQRAGEARQEVMGGPRRGRAEAEARRVSEEMTRRAQEARRRAEQAEALAAQAAAQVPEMPVGIKRVLVPLSGEVFADRAIPYAVAVARLTGAPLAFVHAGDQPLQPARPRVDQVQPAAGAEGAEARPLSLEAVERINLPEGPIAERLIDIESPDGTDLVVLATRRRTAGEGERLSPVAQTLIRRGHAPVMLIRPDVTLPEDTEPTFQRILVALDGSTRAEQTLIPVTHLLSGPRMAGAETSAGEREIVLFSVVEAQPMVADAYRYLNDVSADLQSRVPSGVRCSTVVHIGSPGSAIVAAAGQSGEERAEHERLAPSDLIALATHGRSGLQRWLLGSVAEYVLTHATVPVLVMRPSQALD
jgi:nucleotide-binding universal stress UspA family protein